MSFTRYIPLDGPAFFQELRGWSKPFGREEWMQELSNCCDADWTYLGMVDYLKRTFLDGVPNTNLLPYSDFLMGLSLILGKTPPHSRDGSELLRFCETLAASPFHDIQNLFATIALERVLADSDGWRERFFEAWATHADKDVRSLLAFATCFTEFSQKRELLLRLAEDRELDVRRSVVQSLWYRDTAYPSGERADIAKILDIACQPGEDDDLLANFVSDIRQRNFTVH